MKSISTTDDLHLVVRGTGRHCRVHTHPGTPVQPVSIDIVSANARENAWRLGGKGEFRCACPGCGMQVAIVEQLVPIHCAGLRCPTCRKPESLAVRLRTLNTENGVFEFIVDLECVPCNRKTGFKKILEKVAGLLSIEIGLTGVSFKARSKSKKDE